MAADTVCRVYQFRAAKFPLVTELSLSTNTTVLYQEWEKFIGVFTLEKRLASVRTGRRLSHPWASKLHQSTHIFMIFLNQSIN